MRLRLVVVAPLVLAALACFPGGAGAKVPRFHLRGRQLTRIELEASNGYSILITSDRNRHLVLQTTKEGVTTEYETYDTFADPGRVKAPLSGLGVVSVRFHPRGAVHRLPPLAGCDGPAPTLQRGVARGTIRFTGEREYTKVATHEAPAEIEEWKNQRCRAGSNPLHIDPALADWNSMFSAWGPEAELVAKKYRPGVIAGGQVSYRAEAREVLDGGPRLLVVSRRATIAAPASTFRDAHPEHLTITPPPPFTGTGALSRTPESVFTWEGDLSIQFPGIDPLPLAGPLFEPTYCLRGSGCIRQQSAE